MPMIKITGISQDEVIKESKVLIDELEEIIKCPRDYFRIELSNNIFIKDGSVVGAPQVVEVSWFNRGQEMQDKVAEVITKHFKKNRKYLDVIFYSLKENCYYENGKHF